MSPLSLLRQAVRAAFPSALRQAADEPAAAQAPPQGPKGSTLAAAIRLTCRQIARRVEQAQSEFAPHTLYDRALGARLASAWLDGFTRQCIAGLRLAGIPVSEAMGVEGLLCLLDREDETTLSCAEMGRAAMDGSNDAGKLVVSYCASQGIQANVSLKIAKNKGAWESAFEVECNRLP